MKRMILTTVATVVGIVALLNFKTHAQIRNTGSLPSAASSPTATAPSPSAATSPTPSTRTPSAGATVTPTSYLGDAEQTRYGTVQVKVTVAAGRITNVAFVQLTASDDRSERINSDAAPILLRETITAQSAQIDGVSGASYTSQGYEQSLQSALDKAGV